MSDSRNEGLWVRIRRLLSLRPGEATRVVLVFLYLFLIISSYLVLKPVRSALYLDAFGWEKLWLGIIGVALAVGVFVEFYIRLSKLIRTPILVSLTLLFLASNLVGFWMLAQSGARWLYPVFYIWVGCVGVIAPVQVWTLANEVFSTREARRLLGFIGAGGIAGAIVGGQAARQLAPRVGTVNLLLIVAGVFVVCIGLVALLSRHRTFAGVGPIGVPKSPKTLIRSLRLIGSSSHLKVLAGLIFVSALATTVVDVQFQASVQGAGFTGDELTAFFGNVYFWLGIASLAVQLVLVRPILRNLGLGAAILVLPLSLVMGTGVLLAAGGLLAGVLLKGADGAFKHSMDRAAKELAYLPVSPVLKTQVKSAIDMVIDRFGDGMGGVLQLVLIELVGLGLRSITWTTLVILAVWLVLALRLYRSYLGELEQSIGHRLVDHGEVARTLNTPGGRNALIQGLRSPEPDKILAALDLAAIAPGDDLEPELRRLAKHGTPEVRARVLGVLLEPGEAGLPHGLAEQLEAEDQELMVQALDIVMAETPEEVESKARVLLGDASPGTRGAMLALLVRRLGDEFEPFAGKIFDSLLSPESPNATRRAAACALGLLPATSDLTDRVGTLLTDEDTGVRNEAAQSAGRLRRRELVGTLMLLLEDRRTRGTAQRALVTMGNTAVPDLAATVAAGTASVSVMKRVPDILAEIGTPPALDAVVRGLASMHPGVRCESALALSRARRQNPDLDLITADELAPKVRARLAETRGLMGVLAVIERERDGRELTFLADVLREGVERSFEQVFHLLELRYPPAQIAAAQRGLRGVARVQQDNALELMDGLLSRSFKPRLIPLLEQFYVDRMDGDSRATVSAGLTPLSGALRELVRGADPWLRACALRVAASRGIDNVEEPVSPLNSVELLPSADEASGFGSDGDGGRETEVQVMRADSVGLVDKVMALKAVEALRAVPTEQLSHVAQVARGKVYTEGETLFRDGDPPGPLYILTRGRVALRRGETTTAELGQGSPLGTWSLFDDQPRTADAVALEETEVLVVDREDFYEAIAEHPEIARSLMTDMVRRLRRTLMD